MEKRDALTDYVGVKAEGHGPARRPQQGDDAAGPGHIGHPDEEPLAELGGPVAFTVQ